MTKYQITLQIGALFVRMTTVHARTEVDALNMARIMYPREAVAVEVL